MLRRNIDVIQRLVYSAVGTNINFLQDANVEVKSIDVQFNYKIHKIEPVVSKSEILTKVYVYRK